MHAGYHFSSQLKLWVPLNKGGIHPWIEFSAFMPARGALLSTLALQIAYGVNLRKHPKVRGWVGVSPSRAGFGGSTFLGWGGFDLRPPPLNCGCLPVRGAQFGAFRVTFAVEAAFVTWNLGQYTPMRRGGQYRTGSLNGGG